MTHEQTRPILDPQAPDFSRRQWVQALLAVPAVVALPGCGGGGIGEGGTGAPVSFASGPITGFGSIIVSDVAFDDSTASIEDGDGSSRNRSELRLGMTVEVDAQSIRDAAAQANRIRFDSALLGRIEAIDRADGGLTVLGQAVAVDGTTVFEDSVEGGLASLRVGQVIEVYGVVDPSLRRLRATRIELKVAVPSYRVRGIVEQLDTGSQTIRIGNAQFAIAGVAAPADLAVGNFVRLTVATSQIATGRWTVLSFGTALRSLGSLGDLEDVRLKGLVTRFTSATSFAIDGRVVDASAATSVEGVVALGARIEAEGPVRAGVLRARSVRVRSDQAEVERGFDLRGNIDSVNAAASSFVVRGITVSYARRDIRFENGDVTQIVAGRRVEVRAQVAVLGGGIEATRVRFL